LASVEASSKAIYGALTDAAGFIGSIDFGSSLEPPITQLEASLELHLTPESTRGTLDFTVFTDSMPYGALALDWPSTDPCEAAATPVTAEELESTFGIHGADLMGAACGVLFFNDSLDVSNRQAQGHLEIDTQGCGDELEQSYLVDFLSWCSGPRTFPESPLYRRPPR
jgi:hypothetical protein